MDEKTLLLSILTKWYGKQESEVTDLIYNAEGALNDNAFENLGTLDAARVAKFKTEGSQMFKNGEAKATEQINKKAAKAIVEKLGLDTDSDVLDDVLEVAVTHVAEKTKTKTQPLTDEAVKQHPLYLKLEKERVPKADHEKVVNEYATFKTGVENEKIYGAIDEQAIVSLKKMNPNFEMYKDAPQVLSNLEKSFKQSLREYEFKPDGNGGYLVLKNGERVNDAHGNPETIDNIVKSVAPNFFTFLKQKPKGGAGNEGGEPGGGDGGATNPNFKTSAEYTDYMKSLTNSPEDAKKRVDAFAQYKKMKQEGTIKD
jgi:hypothetical protein